MEYLGFFSLNFRLLVIFWWNFRRSYFGVRAQSFTRVQSDYSKMISQSDPDRPSPDPDWPVNLGAASLRQERGDLATMIHGATPTQTSVPANVPKIPSRCSTRRNNNPERMSLRLTPDSNATWVPARYLLLCMPHLWRDVWRRVALVG